MAAFSLCFRKDCHCQSRSSNSANDIRHSICRSHFEEVFILLQGADRHGKERGATNEHKTMESLTATGAALSKGIPLLKEIKPQGYE